MAVPTARVSAAALVACLLLAVAAPAAHAQSVVVQGIDTAAYPIVGITMLVSPDVVPASGTAPAVRVTENGRTLDDVTVSALDRERAPIDVVLLIDTSGSMKGAPLEDAKAAARRFVESMGPDDRIAVVAFASEPVVLQPFTADRQALSSAIGGLAASGETALYDGLVRAAALAAETGVAERYIVALSDGGDTMSLNPPDNAAGAVTGARTPVYAVALESPEHDPATLDTIARVSGGRMTTATDSALLTDIYQSIAEEMQLRYRVEVVSADPNTLELEYVLSVADGAASARTTVRNPRYLTAPDDLPGIEPGRPSPVALALSLASAFGAVALGAVAVMLILRRDKAALQQLRYYDQLRETGDLGARAADESTVRGALLTAFGTLAERRGFTGLVQRWLDQAGLALRANEYIMLHVAGTIVAGLAVHLLTGGSMLPVTATVLIAVAGPIAFLRFKSSRRLRAFEEQLPDILDLIAGSLRSGWGIQQSIDLVVDEVGEPAREEFRRAQAEARLGLPLEEALQRMALRVESGDLTWAVSAITIQREVGGNLAEVLNTVSRTIRERAELRRQVSALTAEGRFSLVVLTVLPFVVFAGLFVVNPEYMMLALDSPLGIGALASGGLLLAVGIVWLTRVMRIEV